MVKLPGRIGPVAFSSGPVGVDNNSDSEGGVVDYRHVVVVRNFYEALVSGYLYHKSGRECWLSPFGKPLTTNFTLDWKYHLAELRSKYPRLMRMQPKSSVLAAASSNNNNSASTSMCQYLSDEGSEEDGMKVYVAVALSFWYNGLMPYLKIARERNDHAATAGAQKKSLFVCFEDLSDPRKEESLFYEVVDFLFPGGHNYSFPRRGPKATERIGGHATDPDPLLRGRLLDIVRRLDWLVFDNDLSKINQLIPCNGTIH
jgi:hypothetical protein